MKVYIASWSVTEDQYTKLAELVIGLGCTLTLDCAQYRRIDAYADNMRQQALAESRGVAESDVVVMLTPGHPDMWVALGMGMALRKQVVVVADAEQTEEMARRAIGYHPGLRIMGSVEEAAEWIGGLTGVGAPLLVSPQMYAYTKSPYVGLWETQTKVAAGLNTVERSAVMGTYAATAQDIANAMAAPIPGTPPHMTIRVSDSGLNGGQWEYTFPVPLAEPGFPDATYEANETEDGRVVDTKAALRVDVGGALPAITNDTSAAEPTDHAWFCEGPAVVLEGKYEIIPAPIADRILAILQSANVRGAPARATIAELTQAYLDYFRGGATP